MKINSGENKSLVLWIRKSFMIPWLLFPLVCFGFYFLSIYKKPFLLLTKEQNYFSQGSFVPFNDKREKGNSESHLIENKSGLSYRYTLKSGSPYQYTGVWYVTKANTWLDLSNYDYIKIRVKMSAVNWITLSIATDIPGFSVDSIISTHKYLNHVIPVNSNAEETILPIKNFSTPLWWYTMNNKKEGDFKKTNLSKVKYIAFVHSPTNDLGIEKRVDIQELGFYIDYIPFYYKSGLGFAIYLILSFLGFYIINKRTSKRSIQFSYDKVESLNHMDREDELIQEFLRAHFSNSELTVSDVQTGTGISERRVSAIIKNKSGLSFKKYIHLIRILEAKKLLATTDFSIADIAYQCGYSNVSHFNRVFKSTENCTPNDFRKQQGLLITIT